MNDYLVINSSGKTIYTGNNKATAMYYLQSFKYARMEIWEEDEEFGRIKVADVAGT